MTDTNRLLRKIDESGLKRSHIAKKCGISVPWLKKKITGIVPFKAEEIQIICDLLRITDLEEKESLFFYGKC